MTCYINPTASLGWDALLPYVMPYARGVPDQIVLHNVRMAAIDFCKRTGILHDIQTYNLQGFVSNYQLTTDPNYTIIRVVRVTVDKRWDYQPVTSKLPAGIGAYLYHMTSPTTLHLRRPPPIDDPQGLEVETVVQPQQDSCILDNYLYQAWADALASGALERLLAIPQTDWYNPAQARDFGIKYSKEISRARALIDRAFGPRDMMKTENWVGIGNRGWGWSGYGSPNWW
jgi:hypothetical protein